MTAALHIAVIILYVCVRFQLQLGTLYVQLSYVITTLVHTSIAAYVVANSIKVFWPHINIIITVLVKP